MRTCCKHLPLTRMLSSHCLTRCWFLILASGSRCGDGVRGGTSATSQMYVGRHSTTCTVTCTVREEQTCSHLWTITCTAQETTAVSHLWTAMEGHEVEGDLCAQRSDQRGLPRGIGGCCAGPSVPQCDVQAVCLELQGGGCRGRSLMRGTGVCGPGRHMMDPDSSALI